MLRKLLGDKTVDRISDGFRGRPDVDLAGYAASRGLDFRGQRGLAGYFGAAAISGELMWNVMRGELPGGRTGALMHNVALLDPDHASGQFYGMKAEKVGGISATDFIPLSDLFSPNIMFFRLPETLVNIRLPASVPTLVSFHVARRRERARGSKSTDFLVERDLGHGDWRLVCNKRTDRDLLERVVRGPLGEVLGREQELGFTIEYAFGQLLVRRQDFVSDPDELDAFCRQAVGLADGIAALDPPGPVPADFDAPLPEAEWYAEIAAKPEDRYIDATSSAWLEPMVRYATARGMRVEDARAFHTAFASLPIPGMAFGVAAGPGLRLAAACERRIEDLSVYKKEWPDAGMTAGCNMVLLPTTAPDTTEPDGALHEGTVRYAVRDGVMLVSQARGMYQFHAEAMDELVERARVVEAEVSR